jgi:hypothetical protein
MSRTKVILVSAFFVIAAGLYVYLHRDAFRRPVIEISHTRERLAGRRPGGAPNPAPHPTFVLAQYCRLTSVKVIVLDELKAKGFAHPLWELDTKSNSAPVKLFSYGGRIPGMQPAIPGARPEPLTNNVTYRLLVEAGSLKGQHDFTLTDADYPDNSAE